MKHNYVTDIKKVKKEYIEEQEYFLDWETFHERHPFVEKWGYEDGVKKTQEQ